VNRMLVVLVAHPFRDRNGRSAVHAGLSRDYEIR